MVVGKSLKVQKQAVDKCSEGLLLAVHRYWMELVLVDGKSWMEQIGAGSSYSMELILVAGMYLLVQIMAADNYLKEVLEIGKYW